VRRKEGSISKEKREQKKSEMKRRDDNKEKESMRCEKKRIE
jgi:hypothetical protein